jgi:dipeptidyl aminopeptidase/acylaminoacyl peptidase
VAERTRRPASPEDLYRLRVPSDPRISPDGRLVAFTVTSATRRHDDYRSAIWLADADGERPARQVTLGARRDHHPRFSPTGDLLAFLSDRREIVEDEPDAPVDREDQVQVHLLPLSVAGEARRLTDLPRGVRTFEWSPDGRRIALLSSSRAANRAEDARLRGKPPTPRPGDPPRSDYRYVDRLFFQLNGVGFTEGREAQVWIVEVDGGTTRRLAEVPGGVEGLAWSPDGTRLACVVRPSRDRDLDERSLVVALDVASGRRTVVTGGRDAAFDAPVWLPDGSAILALGGRLPTAEYRKAVTRFDAAGRDAGSRGGRDLTGPHDLMPGSMMNSDAATGEPPRIVVAPDGRRALVLAPIDGAVELWAVDAVTAELARLTRGHHYLSAFDAAPSPGSGLRVAAIRSAVTELPEVVVGDTDLAGPEGAIVLRPLTRLNTELAAEVELRPALERRVVVDGREIQGWLIPSAPGVRPLVLEIHGGPHTLYGWAPMWEFQVLAGAGMSVYYANPRGSEGYGLAFNEANLGDWGPGPMRDLTVGVDALVADGLADPDRLGVTGGSYGGYLTNWIVGHDQRFRAALTCRSVVDMPLLFTTGDVGGTHWAIREFGSYPWQEPERWREMSPIAHAVAIRTPLLIQHSENDLRTTMAQAEMLFSVLRRLRRPVRLMRVPDETHELTRSGTPFRRVENVVQVRDWFRHFLVEGRRRMPPKPRERAGR